MEAKLNSIAALGDDKAKEAQYGTLLQEAITSRNVEHLKLLAEHLAAESTPLFVSRALLKVFCDALPAMDAAVHKEVAVAALEALRARDVAFEEAASALRENLSNVYEAEQLWTEAARVLQQIPLESGQRVVSAAEKMTKYVRIAQLYLEDEESVEAERFLNRASELRADPEAARDKQLQLRFDYAFAQVLDFKRQFQRAALKYYQLSQAAHASVTEDEQFMALGNAIKCAVLAAAGPQRSRLLATLYKDERSAKHEHYDMLAAMHFDRIITQAAADRFAEQLADHQKAMTSDGSTVYQRAVLDHNVLAASRLYDNIALAQLGALLGVDARRAEKIATVMIEDKRLEATVDQVDGIVYFARGEDKALLTWDAQIEQSCRSLNAILEQIGKA